MRICKTLMLLLAALLLYGCPSPDNQKKVQEAARVPGLEEAVIAKDRALQAAIEMSWKADVELLQEQLAVEEVHAGKVRITGIVSREKLKQRAEAIAKEQEGVVDVISTITVDESLMDKRFSLDDK
ncbi:MAG: BON domain-containing protein [bacterium]